MNMSREKSYWILPMLVFLLLAVYGCANAPDFKEVQFSVNPGETYRFNIYAEEGNIIEESWKSDEFVYAWYETPGGIPMLAGGSEESIKPPPYESNESGPAIAQTKGDNRSVEIKGKYRGSGYHTLCFRLDESHEQPTTITLRYRVR